MRLEREREREKKGRKKEKNKTKATYEDGSVYMDTVYYFSVRIPKSRYVCDCIITGA